jgi:hypothetical protein
VLVDWLAEFAGVDDVEGARGVRGLIAEGGGAPRDGGEEDRARMAQPERTAACG